MTEAETFDQRVRFEVYDATLRTGTPPLSLEVAATMGEEPAAVLESFGRLAAAHVLVLQRVGGEILMANPFSAVPTPFRVDVGGLSAYGNCIWDALGIPAMLHASGTISASCGDCGSAMEIEVRGESVHGDGLLHFAIPARKWWDDIVFT